MVNGLLVFSLLVLHNVILTNGFGALGMQRNKTNFKFIFLNSLYVAIAIVASAVLYNLIYAYLLDPYNLESLGTLVIVMFSGLFNFLILAITKATSHEMYYHYDTTYSYVINLGLTIGILFCVDPTLGLAQTAINSAFIALGYIIVTVLFACVYHRLHNKKVSRLIRPVPITILTMAVLAMIIYAVGISI